MSRNRSRIAQGWGHRFASTAERVSYAGTSGQRRGETNRRQTRVARGECPDCGRPLTPAERGLVIKGHPVVRCTDCRQAERDRKARSRGEATMKGVFAERLQEADQLLVAKARFEGAAGSKILVVCGRTTNIQLAAREHPRVIVWESTHLEGRRIPLMPTNVSVILMTRFCSHQITQDLRTQAQQRRAFVFGGLLPTGELRKALAGLLDLDARTVDEDVEDEPQVVVTPVAAPKPAPPPTASSHPPPPDATTSGPDDPPVSLDEAISLISESIVALTLVRDELTRTKALISQMQQDKGLLEKARALKALLGSL